METVTFKSELIKAYKEGSKAFAVIRTVLVFLPAALAIFLGIKHDAEYWFFGAVYSTLLMMSWTLHGCTHVALPNFIKANGIKSSSGIPRSIKFMCFINIIMLVLLYLSLYASEGFNFIDSNREYLYNAGNIILLAFLIVLTVRDFIRSVRIFKMITKPEKFLN